MITSESCSLTICTGRERYDPSIACPATNLSTAAAPGAAGSMDMFLFWKSNQSKYGEEATVDYAVESVTSSPLTDLLLLAGVVVVLLFATYCVAWCTMKSANDNE